MKEQESKRYPALPQSNIIPTLAEVLQENAKEIAAQKLEQSIQKLKQARSWDYSEYFSDYDMGYLTVSMTKIEYEEKIKRQQEVLQNSFLRKYPINVQHLERLQGLQLEVQQIRKKVPGSKRVRWSPLDEGAVSNTQFMYELAEKATWKTMMNVGYAKLPGCADPYPVCGSWVFRRCPDHNYGKRVKYACNRLSCPACVRAAGIRIAKKIERRMFLYGLREQFLSKGSRNPKSSHVIEAIHPSDPFWDLPRHKQNMLLKKMRKIAGIKGGVEINHLWRFDEEKKHKPVYSPHNHLIVYGWISGSATGDIKEKLGVDVIYEKVDTLYKRTDVLGVAFYALSHCTIVKNKHSVKWFGCLSYTKISNAELHKFRDQMFIDEDAAIEKSKSCGICGLGMVPARLGDDWHKWRGFMPDDQALEQGCEFAAGLLVTVRLEHGEKMVFYNPKYEHIVEEERKLLQIENNTRSQKIDRF